MNELDRTWLREVRRKYPDFFSNKNVLEIGALDVNGNVRDLWINSKFTGVDWKEGKNVDVVCLAHDTKFKKDQFDQILSVNHLEHDPYWKKSLIHNFKWLKDGGIVFVRWATVSSSKHGPEFDPKHEDGYYGKNLEDVVQFLQAYPQIEIIWKNTDFNKDIGQMANVIAQYHRG